MCAFESLLKEGKVGNERRSHGIFIVLSCDPSVKKMLFLCILKFFIVWFLLLSCARACGGDGGGGVCALSSLLYKSSCIFYEGIKICKNHNKIGSRIRPSPFLDEARLTLPSSGQSC